MSFYLPASWIKSTSSSNVKGPGYFFSLARLGTEFFITGGENPQAIFIGSDYFGKCFRQKGSGTTAGVAIEAVEIEVDFSSVASKSSAGMPPGGIAVVNGAVYIFATTKAQMGFDDTFAWNVETGEGIEYLESGVVFTRWRLCRRSGDDLIEIASINVDKPK